MRRIVKLVGLAGPIALAVASTPAVSDSGPLALTLKNHEFAPAEIHLKADMPAVISITNRDATAEEFDSSALKVEKVIAGNSQGEVRIRPLAPGRYPFMGEYHPDTARGVVIAE